MVPSLFRRVRPYCLWVLDCSVYGLRRSPQPRLFLCYTFSVLLERQCGLSWLCPGPVLRLWRLRVLQGLCEGSAFRIANRAVQDLLWGLFGGSGVERTGMWILRTLVGSSACLLRSRLVGLAMVLHCCPGAVHAPLFMLQPSCPCRQASLLMLRLSCPHRQVDLC
eukprot:1069998-Pelagomonas_calceolata.AAC.1